VQDFVAQDFVAMPSRPRIALLILGSIGFVATGLWMIGAFGDPPEMNRYSPLFITIIGWASILFFGFCGFMGIKLLFDRDEQVRINASGVYWKRWSDQTILWADITDVGVWEHHRQKAIILNLRDPARYRSSTMMGKLSGANRALTGGDVAISLTGTDRKFDDAMAAILHHWQPVAIDEATQSTFR
jgi:hypothetical protein